MLFAPTIANRGAAMRNASGPGQPALELMRAVLVVIRRALPTIASQD